MTINIKIIRFNFILLLFQLSLLISQTPTELKNFMETYNKIKTEQEANDAVRSDLVNNNKNIYETDVKILITPNEISKYYDDKVQSIRNELSKLNDLLILTDSISELKDYGYSFFSLRDSISYIDNRILDDDYVLGYNDEIIFSVWGQVQQYEKKKIERDGTIYVENVGLLYLGGKTLKESKQYVFNRFSKVYSTLLSKPQLSFIDISLGKTKNINVGVSGHVRFPGNYVVNPSISFTNLLILAGGVLETGTLRNIYLKRNNTAVDSLDLYPLLSGVGDFKNLKLNEGDFIIVPAKGKTVSISGAIRNPAFFELKKEDNLKSLINIAGNVKSDSKEKIYIYRKAKSNLTVDIENFSSTKLLNGDSIVVPITNEKYKYLSISIDNISRFQIPWLNGISFEDILNSGDLSIENIKKIELVRKLNDDKYESYILNNFDGGQFEFLPYDYLTIQLFKEKNDIGSVVIEGGVNSPGIYPLAGQSETLKSIINRSGGFLPLINMSNVSIKRDTTTFGSIDGEIVLNPLDTIIVNPYNGTINVFGEVNNPGTLEWFENRSIKDYINLSGGLTALGDKKQIVYISPYGNAFKVKRRSNLKILPGGKIMVNQKLENDSNNYSNILQQISALLSSILTIAVIANSAN